MASMFSYLITFLAILFWVFRLVVSFAFSLEINIGIVPMNFTIEMILLFLTIPCFILIIKRNVIGAATYLVLYALYFGKDFYNTFMNIVNGSTGLVDLSSAFISLVGILIPLLTFVDIVVNKNRVGKTGDKKTDWFYNNEEYERKLDERADKNNYKF